MPGVHQQSVDQIVEECREVESLGIPAVILFGSRSRKTRAAPFRIRLRASSKGHRSDPAKPVCSSWSSRTFAFASTRITAISRRD